MAGRNPINFDVRGMLDVQAQLALVALPDKLRKRLLNRVALRLRTQWRQRVRSGLDIHGNSLEPRKHKRKAKQPATMLGGLAKALTVPRLTADEVELGWGKKLTAIIAGTHNRGHVYRRTAAQLRRWKKTSPLMATRLQAKKLRHLGYKVRLPGKSKRGKTRWMKPGVSWIQENVRYAQAGLLIRLLKDEKPGPTSWNIELPKREFFGPESPEEVGRLFAQLLPQILKSPK